MFSKHWYLSKLQQIWGEVKTFGKTFTNFDGKEKRTKRMTILKLSRCDPLWRKKSFLLRWIVKWGRLLTILENLEWCLVRVSSWIKSDPEGILLDERGCNWNALNEIYGEGFIARLAFCDFILRKIETDAWKKLYFRLERKKERNCTALF